ncbi:MAG: ABC transporter substrate-binding protein/permease [Pirellulales bacterium]
MLNGTGAQSYLQSDRDTEAWKSRLEPQLFDGTTQAMEQVVKGAIPLTLTDDCAAIYYAERYPGLKFVGRPVSQGYYVMLVERGQDEWMARLNDALGRVIADGRLTKLYDRWNMSGQAQTLALRDVAEIPAAVKPSLWELIRTNLPILLQAAFVTVMLACVSMPLAILLGIGVAIGRLYGPKWLKPPLVMYVEFLRGTPLLLQLYALFYLLPELFRHYGIDLELPAYVFAIVGLAVNYSAYEAEIYRAGLQAVPRGQLEAALALGMTRRQAILRIVLPQAFRIVIPPVTNDFIALFKDTSVCSVITVVELTKRYSIQANATSAFLELAILTSILYLVMSYPLALLARYAEKHFGTSHIV